MNSYGDFYVVGSNIAALVLSSIIIFTLFISCVTISIFMIIHCAIRRFQCCEIFKVLFSKNVTSPMFFNSLMLIVDVLYIMVLFVMVFLYAFLYTRSDIFPPLLDFSLALVEMVYLVSKTVFSLRGDAYNANIKVNKPKGKNVPNDPAPGEDSICVPKGELFFSTTVDYLNWIESTLNVIFFLIVLWNSVFMKFANQSTILMFNIFFIILMKVIVIFSLDNVVYEIFDNFKQLIYSSNVPDTSTIFDDSYIFNYFSSQVTDGGYFKKCIVCLNSSCCKICSKVSFEKVFPTIILVLTGGGYIVYIIAGGYYLICSIPFIYASFSATPQGLTGILLSLNISQKILITISVLTFQLSLIAFLMRKKVLQDSEDWRGKGHFKRIIIVVTFSIFFFPVVISAIDLIAYFIGETTTAGTAFKTTSQIISTWLFFVQVITWGMFWNISIVSLDVAEKARAEFFKKCLIFLFNGFKCSGGVVGACVQILHSTNSGNDENDEEKDDDNIVSSLFGAFVCLLIILFCVFWTVVYILVVFYVITLVIQNTVIFGDKNYYSKSSKEKQLNDADRLRLISRISSIFSIPSFFLVPLSFVTALFSLVFSLVIFRYCPSSSNECIPEVISVGYRYAILAALSFSTLFCYSHLFFGFSIHILSLFISLFKNTACEGCFLNWTIQFLNFIYDIILSFDLYTYSLTFTMYLRPLITVSYIGLFFYNVIYISVADVNTIIAEFSPYNRSLQQTFSSFTVICYVVIGISITFTFLIAIIYWTLEVFSKKVWVKNQLDEEQDNNNANVIQNGNNGVNNDLGIDGDDSSDGDMDNINNGNVEKVERFAIQIGNAGIEHNPDEVDFVIEDHVTGNSNRNESEVYINEENNYSSSDSSSNKEPNSNSDDSDDDDGVYDDEIVKLEVHVFGKRKSNFLHLKEDSKNMQVLEAIAQKWYEGNIPWNTKEIKILVNGCQITKNCPFNKLGKMILGKSLTDFPLVHLSLEKKEKKKKKKYDSSSGDSSSGDSDDDENQMDTDTESEENPDSSD